MPIAPFNGTYPAPDKTAPTAPGTPAITQALANETVTITVTASTDAVGVIGYAAFLDGGVNEAGRSATTSINLSRVPAGAHSVVVRAYDARGNYSAASVANLFTIPSSTALLSLSKLGRSAWVMPFLTSIESDCTATQIQTVVEVLSCPVPYRAIRIGIILKGGNGGISGLAGGGIIKMLAASTDDIGDRDYSMPVPLTTKKCVTPKIGGGTYNVIGALAGDPGWHWVTFNKIENPAIPDPGAGNFSVTWSDSLLIDGSYAVEGKYPLLIRGNISVTLSGSAYPRCAKATGEATVTNIKTDLPSKFLFSLSSSVDGVGTMAVPALAAWSDINTPRRLSENAS